MWGKEGQPRPEQELVKDKEGRPAFVHLNSTQAQRSYKNLLQGLGNCISGGTDSVCFRWVNKCSKHRRKSGCLRGHAVSLSHKALRCLCSWERSGAVWPCGRSDSTCNLRTTLIKFVSSLWTFVSYRCGQSGVQVMEVQLPGGSLKPESPCPHRLLTLRNLL